MKEKILIEVKQEHIDKAYEQKKLAFQDKIKGLPHRRPGTYCPVWQACRFYFPNPIAYGNGIKDENGNQYVYPSLVRRFINDFDFGLPISPISFEVTKYNE